jgi:hypothetical protein
MRTGYRILVERPYRNRPVGRPRRGEKHVKMDVRETVWGGVDWSDLAQEGTGGGIL